MDEEDYLTMWVLHCAEAGNEVMNIPDNEAFGATEQPLHVFKILLSCLFMVD